MTEKPVEVLVFDVPPALRKKMVALAKKRNVTVNEVAVSILADAYGVEREPSSRPFSPHDGGAAMGIRMPVELRERIREDEVTMRGLILQKLATHFGVAVPPLGRRPRKT